jgi:hypothetical protein
MKKSNAKWKPGESGNPAGRPKGSLSLTDILRRQLQETLQDGSKLEKAEALVAKLIAVASGGDMQAMKLILDRLEGSPRQAIDLSGSAPAFPSKIVVEIIDPEPYHDAQDARVTRCEASAPDVPVARLEAPQTDPQRAPGGVVFATVADRPPAPRRGQANPIFSW